MSQLPTFVYNGFEIEARGEFLSLTILWRAAGGDDSKQPAKWRALPSTIEFVSHVAEVVLRKSEDDLFDVTRGGPNTATLAHWQVAFAYAKYLSPELHARMNSVYRDHLEGKHTDNGMVPMLERVLNRCLDTSVAAQVTASRAEVKADRAEAKADRALRLVIVNKAPQPKSRHENVKLWQRTRDKVRNTKAKHEKRYGITLDWDYDIMQIDCIARFNSGVDRYTKRITSIDDLELDKMNPDGGYEYSVNFEWIHKESNHQKQGRSVAEYVAWLKGIWNLFS